MPSANALVRAGAFKDRPWEETPCARCRLKEDSTGTIAYDDERPAGEAKAPAEDGENGGPD